MENPCISRFQINKPSKEKVSLKRISEMEETSSTASKTTSMKRQPSR